MSWEIADKYVVKDIWVEKNKLGEWVVVEIQGTRSDGSYWVNGLQVMFSRSEWNTLGEDEIIERLVLEVSKHEEELRTWRQNQQYSSQETEKMKTQDIKYGKIVGKEIFKRTTVEDKVI